MDDTFQMASELLTAARKATSIGSNQIAIQHCEDVIALLNKTTVQERYKLLVEAHLCIAESQWQSGERQEPLLHYDKALLIAKDQMKDSKLESTILLGKGFALINAEKSMFEAGIELMEKSKQMTLERGEVGTAAFVDNLILQAKQQHDQKGIVAQKTDEAWSAWAKAFSTSQRVIVFMNGSPGQADPISTSLILQLMGLGMDFQLIDISKEDSLIPESMRSILPSLEFPQLYANGSYIGSKIQIEELVNTEGTLKDILAEHGITPRPGCDGQRPCEVGALDGLSPEEQLLVEIIAKEGSGDWESKASRLGMDPKSAEELWHALAPRLDTILSNNPTMPCGHTCNTCPTKDQCHLHSALDMEDFTKPDKSL